MTERTDKMKTKKNDTKSPAPDTTVHQPERVMVDTVDNRLIIAMQKLKTARAAVAGLPSLDFYNDADALQGIIGLISDAHEEVYWLQFLPTDVRQSPAGTDEDRIHEALGNILIDTLPAKRDEDKSPPLTWTAAEAAAEHGGAR